MSAAWAIGALLRHRTSGRNIGRTELTLRKHATKFEGEEMVKEVFPNATIIRPATMFGYEDRLLQNMPSELMPKHLKA